MARTYGVPQPFISIFKNLYLDSSCCVRTDTGYTPFFQIATGVRQGCILSPILFDICLDFVMKKTMEKVRTGISWSGQNRLTDLDFADDIALLAEDESKLQQVATCLDNEANMTGLRISAHKSKVMKVGFDRAQLNIIVDDTILELSTIPPTSKVWSLAMVMSRRTYAFELQKLPLCSNDCS
ncbi:hypothetical protein TELCIR_03237 [Teladorsagia circumcincta]|uniref:Reverse transcriptase domain-containing protein n=1 Tax=Teladorsagia circumcincta TaxID=45464 RepID=A0A2G9UWW2_TELCI|nr:hypothetical protein TELCIR_03237 [Teladorsagia circumcincta]